MSKVYFLGAGATKADCPQAPLLKDLLGLMLHKDISDCLKAQTKVREFLSKYFFDLKDKDSTQYPLIQDVLSFIDTCLTSESHLKIDKVNFMDVHQAITYLMWFSIKEGVQRGNGSCISALVDKLRNEDTVISTNYDIIPDVAIFEKHKKRNVINYGVKFRRNVEVNQVNEDCLRFADMSIYFDKGITTLLKLHGSYNWLYCPRCNELDIANNVNGCMLKVYPCLRSSLHRSIPADYCFSNFY